MQIATVTFVAMVVTFMAFRLFMNRDEDKSPRRDRAGWFDLFSGDGGDGDGGGDVGGDGGD